MYIYIIIKIVKEQNNTEDTMRNIDTIRNENNTITFNKDTEIGLYIIEAQQNGRTINTYETFDWEEAKNFWNHEAMYWV